MILHQGQHYTDFGEKKILLKIYLFFRRYNTWLFTITSWKKEEKKQKMEDSLISFGCTFWNVIFNIFDSFEVLIGLLLSVPILNYWATPLTFVFFELQISIWRLEIYACLQILLFSFIFPPYPGVSNELESCYLIMHMRSESLCNGTAKKFDFTEYWWKEFPIFRSVNSRRDACCSQRIVKLQK